MAESRKGPEKVMGNQKSPRKSAENWLKAAENRKETPYSTSCKDSGLRLCTTAYELSGKKEKVQVIRHFAHIDPSKIEIVKQHFLQTNQWPQSGYFF